MLGANAWIPVEVAPSSEAGAEESVSTVMTTKLVAARAEDSLEDAVVMMVQHGLRHLPIIDGMNRVIGLLSERDVRRTIGNPLDVLHAPGKPSGCRR